MEKNTSPVVSATAPPPFHRATAVAAVSAGASGARCADCGGTLSHPTAGRAGLAAFLAAAEALALAVGGALVLGRAAATPARIQVRCALPLALPAGRVAPAARS